MAEFNEISWAARRNSDMGGFRHHVIVIRNALIKIVLVISLTYTLGFLVIYSHGLNKTTSVSPVSPLVNTRKVSSALGSFVHIITTNNSGHAPDKPAFQMYPDIPENRWMDEARKRFDYVGEISRSSISYKSVDIHVKQDWKFLLNAQPCSAVNGVVLVLSTTTNFVARINIRKSWGSPEELGRLGLCLRFFVGTPRNMDKVIMKRLSDENRENGDIIQLNVIESYNNLTLKTLGMLKWASQYSQNTEYIFKIDDDVILHFDRLLAVTKKAHKSFSRFILGHAHIGLGVTPVTNTLSKFYDPVFEIVYNQERYPDYVNGPVYVMTSSIISDILRAADKAPFIHMEDVFVTGICQHIASNITLVHVRQDASMNKYCILRNKDFIFTHHQSSQSILTHWKRKDLRQCADT